MLIRPDGYTCHGCSDLATGTTSLPEHCVPRWRNGSATIGRGSAIRVAADSCLGIAARSLGLNDLDGLVELEGQHGLHRHPERSALGQDLSQRATSCAGAGSDRRSLPASRNGPDNGADGSSTACKFGGSFVRAKPLLTAFSHLARTDYVLPTLYRNRLQVQHKIGGAMKASSFRS